MNYLNWGKSGGVDLSKAKNELKDLNKQYTECISKEFLPKFFAGADDMKIEDFCTDLRGKMLDLDK
jgi:hypothetical protein